MLGCLRIPRATEAPASSKGTASRRGVDTELWKLSTYAPFVNLFQDGVYISPFWEVVVDLSARVGVKKTDQLVYPASAIKIAALWFRCGNMEVMKHASSEKIVYHWRPDYEANPGPDAACRRHPDFLPQRPEDRL